MGNNENLPQVEREGKPSVEPEVTLSGVRNRAQQAFEGATGLLQQLKEKAGIGSSEAGVDRKDPAAGSESKARLPFAALAELISERREQRQLRAEFEQMYEQAEGQRWAVSYNPPGLGINWRKGSEGLLYTGVREDERAVDCNVIVVLGTDEVSLMHISPQTMIDEYVDRIVPREKIHNVDGDREINEMVDSIEDVEEVVVIAGDETLAWAIKRYLTAGENAWGDEESPMLSEELFTTHKLGTGGKEVRVNPESGKMMVRDHTNNKYYSVRPGSAE